MLTEISVELIVEIDVGRFEWSVHHTRIYA